jgi:acetyl esterase/lipase
MDPSCLPEFVNLYTPLGDVRNPLVSPVFGDYTGIPPLLIQVGDYEVIRDDSVRVAAKAQADGVEVKLEVWPGQVHVFQIRGLPESREAVAHIADFMHGTYVASGPADA